MFVGRLKFKDMKVYNVILLAQTDFAYVEVYSFASRISAEQKVEDIYADLQEEYEQELLSIREDGKIRVWNDDNAFTISIKEQEIEE